MKAGKVKGLRADMPLAQAAARIVRMRLEELDSFVPRALDPDEVGALHDLRIAAKRLRYLLEVMAPALGEHAAEAAKRARDVQEVVGEVHDCDVLLPRVQELLDERGAESVNDPAYRGLAVLAAHLRSRRAEGFRRFVELWPQARSALTPRGYDGSEP